MKQEDKSLLLKDLCARLPYGVIFKDEFDENLQEIHYIKNEDIFSKNYPNLPYWIETIKPYLRSISSMTEEEKKEWADLFNKPLIELDEYSDKYAEEIAPQMFAMSHISSINWLYSKHFNIILPKEMFIEVTKENNPYK